MRASLLFNAVAEEAIQALGIIYQTEIHGAELDRRELRNLYVIKLLDAWETYQPSDLVEVFGEHFRLILDDQKFDRRHLQSLRELDAVVERLRFGYRQQIAAARERKRIRWYGRLHDDLWWLLGLRTQQERCADALNEIHLRLRDHILKIHMDSGEIPNGSPFFHTLDDAQHESTGS